MIAKIILITLSILTLGIHIGKHGKPKEGEYNVGYQLIGTAILFLLYYYAGIFRF